MSAVEIAAFVASAVSVAVGILAIWLAVTFYRMSSRLSESTREASREIGSTVDRLEQIFNKLYSDTFGLMKETFSDMRRHVWPEQDTKPKELAEEAEKRSQEKVDQLRSEIGSDISHLLEKQGVTDHRLETLRDELLSLVDRAAAESKEVESEAREETQREHVEAEIKRLRQRHNSMRADAFVNKFLAKFPDPEFIDELYDLKNSGSIWWKGEKLGPDTRIYLMSKNEAKELGITED